MKIMFFAFALILVNLQMFSGILIETGKQEQYCFYKNVDQSDKIHLSFVVSGDNEEKVNVVLVDDHDNILHQAHGADHGDFKGEAKSSGVHKLCFLPMNSNNYYISFEFFSEFEKGHTLNMAKDENLHDMKKDMGDITLMFEEMETNVKFIMDRRNKHTQIVSEISSSIRHISYLKILVVILVSLLQVFLIHRFFGGAKKSSVSYGNNLFEMSGSSL
jgi:hypothetical protein